MRRIASNREQTSTRFGTGQRRKTKDEKSTIMSKAPAEPGGAPQAANATISITEKKNSRDKCVCERSCDGVRPKDREIMIWGRIMLQFLFVITPWESSALTKKRRSVDYTGGVRSFRHISGSSSSLADWEVGLREAVLQALLRERYQDPNLRERLVIAPLIGRQDSASPFGDVAVLARGQVYGIHGGNFAFVQDPYRNDCDDCHSPRRCARHQCQPWTPHNQEQLIALWTVKRLRHRDFNNIHRYEIEYTISPINSETRDIVTRRGRFNYAIPGHVFVIKSHDNSINLPTPSYQEVYNRKIPHKHFKPDILIGVDTAGHKHVLHSYPGFYTHPVHPSNDQDKNNLKENDLYNKLIETLATKTSTTTQREVPHHIYMDHYGGTTKSSSLANTPPFSTSPPITMTHPVFNIITTKPTMLHRTTIRVQENARPMLTTVHYFMPDGEEQLLTSKVNFEDRNELTTKREELLPPTKPNQNLVTSKPTKKNHKQSNKPTTFDESTVDQLTTIEMTTGSTKPTKKYHKTKITKPKTTKYTTPKTTYIKPQTTPKKKTSSISTIKPKSTTHISTSTKVFSTSKSSPITTSESTTISSTQMINISPSTATISTTTISKSPTKHKASITTSTAGTTTKITSTTKGMPAASQRKTSTTLKTTSTTPTYSLKQTSPSTTKKQSTMSSTSSTSPTYLSKQTSPSTTKKQSTMSSTSSTSPTYLSKQTSPSTTKKQSTMSSTSSTSPTYLTKPTSPSTTKKQSTMSSTSSTSPTLLHTTPPTTILSTSQIVSKLPPSVSTIPPTIQTLSKFPTPTNFTQYDITSKSPLTIPTELTKSSSTSVASSTLEVTTELPITNQEIEEPKDFPKPTKPMQVIPLIPSDEEPPNQMSAPGEEIETTPYSNTLMTTRRSDASVSASDEIEKTTETTLLENTNVQFMMVLDKPITTAMVESTKIMNMMETTQRTPEAEATMTTGEFHQTTETFAERSTTLMTEKSIENVSKIELLNKTETTDRLPKIETTVEVEDEEMFTSTQATTFLQANTDKSTQNVSNIEITTQKITTRATTKQTSKTTRKQTESSKKPAVVPNDFLVEAEPVKELIYTKPAKQEYNLDDIFGPTIATTKLTLTTTAEQIESDLALQLFGEKMPSTFKVIYSNFYEPSTDPTLIKYDETTMDFRPLTSQSYETSISYKVNRPRASSDSRNSENIHKEQDSENSENGHKEDMSDDKYVNNTTESGMMKEKRNFSTKKDFDVLAMQLVNHARVIDYKSKTSRSKYKRRTRKPKSRQLTGKRKKLEPNKNS